MNDQVLLGATVWTGGLFTRELGRAGRLAFSVDFEREADYVGAYMRRVPVTILLGGRNSGELIPWRCPTAFVPA
jgi:hypothetical protein